MYADALPADASAAPAEVLPIGRLAEALSATVSPIDALRLLLEYAIGSVQAEYGAILLTENGSPGIAVARDHAGGGNVDGSELASDGVVAEVLARGRAISIGDVTKPQWGHVARSVFRADWRTFVCIPMEISGRPMGVLYLARRAPSTGLPRHLPALSLLAGLAVPFVAQLRRAAAASAGGVDSLVGESAKIAEVRRAIQKVGPSDLSVLVVGETGTGKELAARALHDSSDRRAKPIVPLNCSAVPESLLESELFGSGKGAFTGSVRDRPGRFEAADGSTLFLDEVGDMPLSMQAALLRVLEERVVVRVGESVPRPVDFRLVSATHKDLSAEVGAGRFREDLLFRIREVTLEMPPLRERDEDVSLMARLFLRQTEQQLGLPVHVLSRSAEDALARHDWSGNVRELRAVMRRAAVLSDHVVVTPADLDLTGAPGDHPLPNAEPTLACALPNRPLAEARDEFVVNYVTAAIARQGGDRAAAAAALGISLRSLYRYMRAARRHLV